LDYVSPFRLDRMPACDGQTDILPRHNPRYAYASRGKNVWNGVVALTGRPELQNFALWAIFRAFPFPAPPYAPLPSPFPSLTIFPPISPHQSAGEQET